MPVTAELSLRAHFDKQLTHAVAEVRTEIRTGLAAQRAEAIKRSFLFGIGLVVTVFVSRVLERRRRLLPQLYRLAVRRMSVRVRPRLLPHRERGRIRQPLRSHQALEHREPVMIIV